METELAGKVASKHSLPVWIAASATIAIAIAGDLHSARAAILWCMAIGLWAFYFWPDVAQKPSRSNPRPFSLAGLVIVLIAAAGTRLYRLVDLPLGPFASKLHRLGVCRAARAGDVPSRRLRFWLDSSSQRIRFSVTTSRRRRNFGPGQNIGSQRLQS